MTATKQETTDKEWKIIDYTNTSVYRTVKAFQKEGITWIAGEAPAGMQRGIPEKDFTLLKRLRKLDATIVPKNGPVEKIITSMMRQVVKQPTKERNKLVSVECLTVRGQFKGYDFAGVEIGQEFLEGSHKKLIMGKVYRTNQRFNPETGEDLGKIEVQKTIDEYTIEVPKDVAKRKKLIDEIIENANGTLAENIHYYFKDTERGFRDPTFSYQDFVSKSIEELKDLSYKGGGSKSPGYWRDPNTGKLKDRDGNPVT
jgi:hypothetical protein